MKRIFLTLMVLASLTGCLNQHSPTEPCDEPKGQLPCMNRGGCPTPTPVPTKAPPPCIVPGSWQCGG